MRWCGRNSRVRAIGFLVLGCLMTVAWRRGGASTAAAELSAAGGADLRGTRGSAAGRARGNPHPRCRTPPHRLHLGRPGRRGAGAVADREDGAHRRRPARGGTGADHAAPSASGGRDRSGGAHAPARRSSGRDSAGRARLPRAAVHGRAFPHRARSTRSSSRRWRRASSRPHRDERNRTIDLGGGATLTLLSPPDPPIARSRSDVNANSVVAGWITGRSASCSRRTRSRRPSAGCSPRARRLPAQILKVAHHGGRYSSTATFLRAVSPQAAVISGGRGQ